MSAKQTAQHGLQLADLRIRLAGVLDELEAGDAGVDAAVELLLSLLEDLDAAKNAARLSTRSDDRPLWRYIDLSPPIPSLVVRVELESSEAEFYIEAACDEDEQAFRGWLRTNPSAVVDLADEVREILDDLVDAA